MNPNNNFSSSFQMSPDFQQPQMDQREAWEQQQKIWAEQKQRREEEKQSRFKKLGASTLLYAIFYTFCMYNNLAGITMPLWITATIFYACFALKQFGVAQKKDGFFHISVMILLGISTVLTGNFYIIAMNYIGFFLLLISFLLHTVYDDRSWGIGTYLCKMMLAVFGAIGKLSAPFEDSIVFRKLHPTKANKKVCYIIIGLVMAVPSMIFLAGLLASADAVFQNFVLSTLTCIALPTNWFGVVALFAFAFLSAYCGLSHLLETPHPYMQNAIITRKISSVIAIAFTSPITLLYVAFSLVQIFYLFLGFGTLPDGMSYADYARTGFFQLLFICFLNFILVLFVQNFVEESRLLRGILLMICGATYVMIASSAYRILLYVSAYQLTFLRIFVLVALVVIAFLMAGVIISLFKKQFQIYKYSLIVVSVIYLAFSFSHVDYFVASYNLSHVEASALSDALEYIGTLSSDAAPAIASYMDENKDLQKKADAAYENNKSRDDDWIYDLDSDTSWYLLYTAGIRYEAKNSSIRRFNVSQYIASKVLAIN